MKPIGDKVKNRDQAFGGVLRWLTAEPWGQVWFVANRTPSQVRRQVMLQLREDL